MLSLSDDGHQIAHDAISCLSLVATSPAPLDYQTPWSGGDEEEGRSLEPGARRKIATRASGANTHGARCHEHHNLALPQARYHWRNLMHAILEPSAKKFLKGFAWMEWFESSKSCNCETIMHIFGNRGTIGSFRFMIGLFSPSVMRRRRVRQCYQAR